MYSPKYLSSASICWRVCPETHQNWPYSGIYKKPKTEYMQICTISTHKHTCSIGEAFIKLNLSFQSEVFSTSRDDSVTASRSSDPQSSETSRWDIHLFTFEFGTHFNQREIVVTYVLSWWDRYIQSLHHSTNFYNRDGFNQAMKFQPGEYWFTED